MTDFLKSPESDGFNNPGIRDYLQEKFNKKPAIETISFTEISLIGDNETQFNNIRPQVIIDASIDKQAESDALMQNASQVFDGIIEGMNKKYGLSVHIEFGNLNSIIKGMSTPEERRIRELYVSETFSVFRSGMLMQMMSSIAILSAQVMDPKHLLDISKPLEEKIDLMRDLFEFLNQVEELNEKINIKSAAMELEKLSDSDVSEVDINSPDIKNFLDSLKPKKLN